MGTCTMKQLRGSSSICCRSSPSPVGPRSFVYSIVFFAYIECITYCHTKVHMISSLIFLACGTARMMFLLECMGQEASLIHYLQSYIIIFKLVLLMQEILHHLGCIKPYEYWDIYYINWCSIPSIDSIIPTFEANSIDSGDTVMKKPAL